MARKCKFLRLQINEEKKSSKSFIICRSVLGILNPKLNIFTPFRGVNKFMTCSNYKNLIGSVQNTTIIFFFICFVKWSINVVPH